MAGFQSGEAGQHCSSREEHRAEPSGGVGRSADRFGDAARCAGSCEQLDPGTANAKRQYGVFAAVFAYAGGAESFGRSPVRNIKLPPIKSTRRMKLTQDQVKAIARAHPRAYSAMV